MIKGKNDPLDPGKGNGGGPIDSDKPGPIDIDPTVKIEIVTSSTHFAGQPGKKIPIHVTGSANAFINGQENPDRIASVQVRLGKDGAFEEAQPPNPQHDLSSWSYSGSVTRSKSGELLITAKVLPGGAKDQKTVSVVIDDIPPEVKILEPQSGEEIEKAGPDFIIPAAGTANDTESGVQEVLIGVDDSDLKPAVNTGGDWSTWLGKKLKLSGTGSHTIKARAVDVAGNERETTVRVTAVDTGPPDIKIDTPTEGADPVTWEKGKKIEVTGMATDRTSGIKKVECKIGKEGDPKTAQLKPTDTNGEQRWSAELVIPEPGEHRITVHAFDKAEDSNKGVKTRDFVAAVPSGDFATGTTRSDYLKDLLLFAGTRIIRKESGKKINEKLLTEIFHQPFKRLMKIDFSKPANRGINQIRIAVEVLRGFLGKQAGKIESGYPEAAYYALLRQLGTSNEEIRLARGADEETHRALAERLGIEAGAPLDGLFIPPKELSETRLEQIFGLVDTNRDPLEPPPNGTARLLIWRRQYLRNRWKKTEPAADSTSGESAPVIDPDLIGESDIANAVEGNTAFDLLKTRQNWVADKLERIRNVRKNESDPAKAFAAVIKKFLGADVDLEKLAGQREQGVDIQPQLDELKLDLAAFLHLVRIRKLATEKKILDSDWEAVDDILVQVCKRREKYHKWRKQERNQELIISPNHFRLREEDASAVELSRWRARRKVRHAWEDTLEARIKQDQAIERTLKKAVDEVEHSALPILRDSLIAKAVEENDDIDANWLTQRLAIDVSGQGEQKTTRARQAIETLQTVLFSVRAGRFGTLDPVPEKGTLTDWQIIDKSKDEEGGLYNENHFDKEWQWMSNYDKWRSAMGVFMYPENYLLPSLREKKDTPFWNNFIKKLRNEPHLTRQRAYEIANGYLQKMYHTHDDLEQTLGTTLDGFKKFTEQRSRNVSSIRDGLEKLLNKREDPAEIKNRYKEIFLFVPLQIALKLQKSGEYLAALDWFRLVYAHDLPDDKRKIYYGLVLEEGLELRGHRPVNWLLNGLNPHQIVNKFSRRPNAYTRFTLQSLVRCLLDYADSEFARETTESLPKARDLYLTALEQLDHPALQPPENNEENPFPPNDLPDSLRRHAETNLHKLRQGRNIAGMQLPTGLQPDTSHLELKQASQYRYPALIERAKQLVSIAQQVEANYLSTLEKRDSAAYTLLQAEQDVELTRATVDLQDLRVTEAKENKELARLQKEKAEIRSETYGDWIGRGKIDHEYEMISAYRDAAEAQKEAANWSSAFTGAQRAQSMGQLGYTAGAQLGPVGATLGAAAGIGAGIFGTVEENEAIKKGIDATMSAQIASVRANFERRKQQWELQKGLAEQDIDIGAQQKTVSQDHFDVVQQEKAIAETQFNFAKKSKEFLETKFTNEDLYDWMSSVLSRVYAYFLQQATATARLAQRQLAFQRQVKPPSAIQADYWSTSNAAANIPNSENGEETDRRGMTGSARLLEDIYRLDQHAFETRKRKLELSQTFSLARLVPYEFQRFRQTGTLLFETPRVLFDQVFPGHHLRMIKRVRVSVVALVPPTEGIKASLSASGLSRVVTGSPDFEISLVRHYPERIAFTSPSNATGVLELQPNDEGLLFPFEGMGVDTAWELEMPKPANAFDYRTVSDVLLTVEYTALHSDRYRQQVISLLGRSVAEDRTFSFRNQFPDQWYNLHNPAQTDTPMVVQFDSRRQDFPPNLDELDIQQILLYFVRTNGSSFEIDVDHLHLIADQNTFKGGEARSTNGVISTRRANGAGWLPLTGRKPTGTWELALPNTQKVKDRFKNEEIEDIIFVIGYEGQTPAWPE